MAVQRYEGGCHCGAVRYEVDLDLDKGTIRCNCSLCSKARAWFAFAPFETFRYSAGGEADEIQYRWTPANREKPNLTYNICSTCGIRTHADGIGPDGKRTVAINVPTLEGVDPELLAAKIRYVDGRHDHFDREPDHIDAL